MLRPGWPVGRVKTGQQAAAHVQVLIMLTSAEKLLEELSDPSEEFVIIVEGYRDKKALESAGILRVRTINKGIHELAEDLWQEGVRRAVILTDDDRTGRSLARKLEHALRGVGIRILPYRERFFRIFKIVHVEELPYALEVMENGENLHRLRKVSHSRSDNCRRHGRETRRHRCAIWTD